MHLAVDEAHKMLHAIQNRLNLQLNSWSPLGLCFLDNCRLTQSRGQLFMLLHFLEDPRAGSEANTGNGPQAAIHSGLESALGSHPCVALSSYQAPPLYGSLEKLHETVIHSGRKQR